MKKSILSITMAALLGLGVVSCREQKSDAEKAGEEVEETMEEGAEKKELERAMEDYIIEKDELVGVYSK